MTAPPGPRPVIELNDVTFRRERQEILQGVTFTVREGEHWALLGPNGAGKSTILALCGAVTHPTSGTVHVLGQQLGRVELQALRRAIGHVNPRHPLQSPLTVRDIVLTGVTGSLEVPLRWQPGPGELDRAEALISAFGLAPKAGDRWPTLSQGERGRALIARALICDPRLLLLDEPSTGLDVAAREQLLQGIDLLDETHPGIASILVTHHLEELPVTTTHALLLAGGRVVAAGPARPSSPPRTSPPPSATPSACGMTTGAGAPAPRRARPQRSAKSSGTSSGRSRPGSRSRAPPVRPGAARAAPPGREPRAGTARDRVPPRPAGSLVPAPPGTAWRPARPGTACTPARPGTACRPAAWGNDIVVTSLPLFQQRRNDHAAAGEPRSRTFRRVPARQPGAAGRPPAGQGPRADPRPPGDRVPSRCLGNDIVVTSLPLFQQRRNDHAAAGEPRSRRTGRRAARTAGGQAGARRGTAHRCTERHGTERHGTERRGARAGGLV